MPGAKRKAGDLSASSPPPSADTSSPASLLDASECHGCTKTIPCPGTYFALPCCHVLCLSCINTCHCERGSAPFIECPAMNCSRGSRITEYFGHSTREVSNGGTSRSEVQRSTSAIVRDPVQTYVVSEPLMKESPYYVHDSLHPTLKKDDVYISITYASGKYGKTECVVSRMKSQPWAGHHCEDNLSDTDKKKLEMIFKLGTHSTPQNMPLSYPSLLFGGSVHLMLLGFCMPKAFSQERRSTDRTRLPTSTLSGFKRTSVPISVSSCGPILNRTSLKSVQLWRNELICVIDSLSARRTETRQIEC